MTVILETARASIYLAYGQYYVYSGQKLIRVCPSIGMAHEVASGL
jgi:hypothetical protein